MASGQGLAPRPPNLEDAAREWTAAELHWIIHNGIKFTGMPAGGKTLSESELRDVVRFVHRLPQMNADDYRSALVGD